MTDGSRLPSGAGAHPSEYASLDGNEAVKVSGVRGNENMFVHMNFNTPPFDDPAFRQAVAHALNYETIIETGYFGKASKWNGQIPSTYPGYHESDVQYEYDVEKAKALLAESGYVDDGSLQLSYVAEKESTLGPIVTQIRSDLAAVGITVQLDPLPQTQYGDRQLVKKDLPFAVNDQEKPIGVDAGYAALLFFVSAEKGGLNNMVNYSSPKVDELYASASVEQDEVARDQMLADLQDQLQTDLPWVPVVEYDTQWAHDSDLQGLTWHPDNSIRWSDLSLG
jgi:peptide/nickel transport system substrate-binding protein